jgi:hypothetical protein
MESKCRIILGQVYQDQKMTGINGSEMYLPVSITESSVSITVLNSAKNRYI